MTIQPKLTSCTIVLVGHFNPLAFQPAWLIAREIEKEADLPREGEWVHHPQITRFSFGSRQYSVEPERFMVGTNEVPWMRILDAASSIFGEHLPGTPLRGFGVNREVHYDMKDAKSRSELFWQLAPTEPWGDYGQAMKTKEPELAGGLSTLAMVQKAMHDNYSLDTNVTVQPSIKFREAGVFIAINAHHMLRKLPGGHGADQAIKLLEQGFKKSIDEADKIIENVAKLAAKK